MVACIFDPYERDEQELLDNDTPSKYYNPDLTPMYKWDRKRWDTLKNALLKTKKLLVRQDANYNIQEVEEDVDENYEINHDINDKKCFRKYLDKVIQLIDINQSLSLVRYPIEKQIDNEKQQQENDEEDEDDKKEQPLNVKQEDVIEFV